MLRFNKDNNLDLVSLRTAKIEFTFTTHVQGRESINNLILSTDGRWMAVSSNKNRVRLWDLNDVKRPHGEPSGIWDITGVEPDIKDSPDKILKFEIDKTGQKIYVLTHKKFHILNTQTWRGNSYPLVDVADNVIILANGQLLASQANPAGICLINPYEPLRRSFVVDLFGEMGPGRRLPAVAVPKLALPAGLVAMHGWNNEIRIWDTNTTQFVATFAGHKREITHILASADGQMLITYSESNGEIKIWY